MTSTLAPVYKAVIHAGNGFLDFYSVRQVHAHACNGKCEAEFCSFSYNTLYRDRTSQQCSEVPGNVQSQTGTTGEADSSP